MLLSMLFRMQYRLFWTLSQDFLLPKSFGNAVRWLGTRTTVSQLGRQRSCFPGLHRRWPFGFETGLLQGLSRLQAIPEAKDCA